MAQRVFVTGGSGFVGSRLLAALGDRGHAVVALDRSGSIRTRSIPTGDFDVVEGDLLDPAAYAPALEQTDVVIHLAASTGRASRDVHFRVNAEGTKALVAQCQRSGVERFLFVSSIAATFADKRDYHYAQAKLCAEEAVRQSGLSFAIVRPTMILGPESPILASLEKLAGLPVVPVFGTGRAVVQPVHVDDVVASIITVVEDNLFSDGTFEVGGPTALTIEELLQHIRQARRGRRGRAVHIPLGLVLPPLRAVEVLGLGRFLPLSAGQLSSFRSDSTIQGDPLHDQRRAALLDLPAMLRHDEAEPSVRGTLERECRVFTGYLIGRLPSDYVVRKYVEAHGIVPGLSATGRFQEFLVGVARRHRVLTRPADSYARLLAPDSGLRRKLVLLLAILETSAPSYRAIDVEVCGPPALTMARLAWRGGIGVLSLLVGAVIFTPARLAFAVVGRGAR